MQQDATIQFIGHIDHHDHGFAIALRQELSGGLKGLEGFSHAVILWWANQAESPAERAQLVYAKPYANNPDDVGVFGSRSPSRPNPIGMSVITISALDKAQGTIVTPYIDTEPGTPVVDVKPYFPASDRAQTASVPAWCKHWPSNVEASAEFDWEAEFE